MDKNIILDPLYIFKLGLAGAAIATVQRVNNILV